MIYSRPLRLWSETDKVTDDAIGPDRERSFGLTNASQNEPFLQLLTSAAAGHISVEPIQLWRWHGHEMLNGFVMAKDGALES